MCRGQTGGAFRVAQVETSGGRDRHRTDRVQEVAEAVLWASRQRDVHLFGTWTPSDVDREGRGAKPERLANPGRCSGPNVSPVEGRDSDLGRGSGRKAQSYQAMTVEVVSSKPL